MNHQDKSLLLQDLQCYLYVVLVLLEKKSIPSIDKDTTQSGNCYRC